MFMVPVSAKKKMIVSKPLPCSPAAETALQPLIWRSENKYSYVYSSPEECFFADTGASAVEAYAKALSAVSASCAPSWRRCHADLLCILCEESPRLAQNI